MPIERKILIALLVVLLIAPQYDGWRILGDRFATWKNDGMLASEARCAVLLSGQTSARKID